MRYIALALLTLLAGCSKKKPGPEELFREMEKTVLDGTSMQFKFSLHMVSSADLGSPSTMEGTLAMEAPAKANLELKGRFPNRVIDIRLISNGTKYKAFAMGKADFLLVDTPPNMFKYTAKAWCRGNLISILPGMIPAKGFGLKFPESDIDREFPVSNFTMGIVDRVDGRISQVVEFTVTQPTSVAVQKVWIDVDQKAPIKREVKVTKGSEVITYTEHYTDMRVNQTIVLAPFNLPD